ncbi:MAG: prepilin peptidase [Micromonosporaceae bacterium]|nr:prepilin peptidase [Micromonosporaceae bacterium]
MRADARQPSGTMGADADADADADAKRHGAGATLVRAILCGLTLTPLLRWAVVHHSVPADQVWRRTCVQCSIPLGPRGDLRALSPLARCGNCRSRLGPPPWSLEVVTAMSIAALVWYGPTGLPLAGYLWWAAVGIVLAFVDLAVRRLPARLSYAAVAGLLSVLWADAQLGQVWQPWTRSVAGSLITAAALAASALVMPRMVHWGDVRYGLAVGAAAAWSGWLTLYAAVFLATLVAALVGLGLLLLRRASLTTYLPQGPFLYGGTLLAVLLTAMAEHGP